MDPREAAAERRTLALLAAAGAIYYLSYLAHFPFRLADEGNLYYIADALGQGLIPYRDIRFLGYLPGLFYLFIPLVSWHAHEIVLARALMLLGLVARSLLLYSCARRFTGRRVALVAAAAVTLVPGPWHKFYVGLLALLVLRALMSYLDRPGVRTARNAGMALGLAALLRIDVTVAGAVLLLAVLALRVWRERQAGGSPGARELLAAPLAAAVVTLPMQLLFLIQGVWLEHVRQWLDFIGYVTRRSVDSGRLQPPAPGELFELGVRGANAWVYYGALLIVLVYLLLHVRPRTTWVHRCGSESPLSSALPGLVGLWVLSGLPQFSLDRPDAAHVAQFAPFYVLPAAILFERALSRLGGRRARRFAAAVAVCLALLFVVKHFRYLQGDTAAVLGREVPWNTLSNGFSFPGPKPRALEIIVQESSPNDRIAALPYEPGIAFATRRRLVGRDVFLLPESIVGPGVEAEYLRILRTTPPRFVVYQQGMSFNNRRSGRLAFYAPQIDRYLEAHYRPVGKPRKRTLLEPRWLPERKKQRRQRRQPPPAPGPDARPGEIESEPRGPKT